MEKIMDSMQSIIDRPLCQVRFVAENMRANVKFLRSLAPEIMPVIKADAYGHGLEEVFRLLQQMDIARLAVGTVREGVRLRNLGFSGIIVPLLGINSWQGQESDAALAAQHQLCPVLHDWHGLHLLAQQQASLGQSLGIAIKCDTGMARLGFCMQESAEELAKVAEFLKQHPLLQPDLLLSHLAVADEQGQQAFTRQQAQNIVQALGAMRALFPNIKSSLGNSACLLAQPELAGDVGRPGIALYGGNPFYGTTQQWRGENLKSALEVKAPVLEVHPLRAGQSIGYGRSFLAPKDMNIAVVGIGYADGFRRNAASGAALVINGQRAPIVGRVSMQMTCVDISEHPPINPGDWAFILGGEGAAVSPAELANWWNTIDYEVLCQLGKNRLTCGAC